MRICSVGWDDIERERTLSSTYAYDIIVRTGLRLVRGTYLLTRGATSAGSDCRTCQAHFTEL